MKSWSGSRPLRGFFGVLGIGILGLAGSFASASPADGLACLEQYDLGCARAEASREGSSTEAQLLASRLAFYLGDFTGAVKGLEKIASQYQDEEKIQRELDLFRRTATATSDFALYTQGSGGDAIEVRYQPGMDRVMIEEAAEVLDKSRQNIGALLGGAPPEGIRIEIYPTIPRFTDASSLPASAVRTTGVVALSKWSRLLITSPRALGRGYAWKDTVAHEYTHYIVSWRTQDKTPVWLQEGIARAVEHRWRAQGPPELSPYSQSLLAEALAQDSFIPLEKMHPSIAFLDSARDASLAYAQVCTMIAFLQQQAGENAISLVLDQVRGGTDAVLAVAKTANKGASFPTPEAEVTAFMNGWKGYLKTLGLVARKLQDMPSVPDAGASTYDLDPVLAKRRDLAGYARLGDLLAGQGHLEAALVEYKKAVPSEEPPPPVLVAHTAEVLLKLGREAEARALLEASILDYPEVAATHAALGRIRLRAGDQPGALTSLRASADIDPFDPEIQGMLADLYGALGQPDRAARHAGYKRVLESGGLDQDKATP